MSRISPRNGTKSQAQPLDQLEVFERDIRLKRRSGDGGPESGGGQRGRISALSKASRARLVLTARNLPPLELHGCETYPAVFPADGLVVKRDWSALRDRMTRRGWRGLMWLEFQKRGAPHLHQAIGVPPGTDLLEARAWLAQSWFEVVGSGDPKHLKAGTYLDPWRSGVYGLQDYVAKEAAKWVQKVPPPGFENVGRFWSLWGGVAVPREVINAPREALARTVRVVRAAERADRRGAGLAPRADKGVTGFTAYGAAAAARRWLAEGEGHDGG